MYHSEVGVPVRWKWIVIKVHFALSLTIASQKVFVLDVYGSKYGTVMVAAGETSLCGKH